jgi:hypothetical protein
MTETHQIRTTLKSGDVDHRTYLHEIPSAKAHGWDDMFEAHVSDMSQSRTTQPMRPCGPKRDPRQRIKRAASTVSDMAEAALAETLKKSGRFHGW